MAPHIAQYTGGCGDTKFLVISSGMVHCIVRDCISANKASCTSCVGKSRNMVPVKKEIKSKLHNKMISLIWFRILSCSFGTILKTVVTQQPVFALLNGAGQKTKTTTKYDFIWSVRPSLWKKKKTSVFSSCFGHLRFIVNLACAARVSVRFCVFFAV